MNRILLLLAALLLIPILSAAEKLSASDLSRLETLINTLKDTDYDARADARAAISAYGDPAKPVLEQRLIHSCADYGFSHELCQAMDAVDMLEVERGLQPLEQRLALQVESLTDELNAIQEAAAHSRECIEAQVEESHGLIETLFNAAADVSTWEQTVKECALRNEQHNIELAWLLHQRLDVATSHLEQVRFFMHATENYRVQLAPIIESGEWDPAQLPFQTRLVLPVVLGSGSFTLDTYFEEFSAATGIRLQNTGSVIYSDAFGPWLMSTDAASVLGILAMDFSAEAIPLEKCNTVIFRTSLLLWGGSAE